MAKELPYFQFEPAEHLAGDIQMCSLAAQGLFANIKSIYWIKGCELSLRQLKSRFSQTELLDELIQEKALKVKNDSINITFLDRQYGMLLDRRKRLSAAGKKGYLKKVDQARLKPPLSNGDEATLKQPEEKRREDINSTTDISKPELQATSGENEEAKDSKKQLSFEDKYKWFIGIINEFGNRKFKGDSKAKRQFKARLADYTSAEIRLAVQNLYKDPTHREQNFKYATPEFITRSDKMERYVAQKR